MNGACESESAAASAAAQSAGEAAARAQRALNETRDNYEAAAYAALAACGGTVVISMTGSIPGTIVGGGACGAAINQALVIEDQLRARLDKFRKANRRFEEAVGELSDAVGALKECVEELSGIVILDE